MVWPTRNLTRALLGLWRGSREHGRRGLQPAAGDRASEEFFCQGELRNGVMPWARGKGPREVILFLDVKMREIKTCLQEGLLVWERLEVGWSQVFKQAPGAGAPVSEEGLAAWGSREVQSWV